MSNLANEDNKKESKGIGNALLGLGLSLTGVGLFLFSAKKVIDADDKKKDNKRLIEIRKDR